MDYEVRSDQELLEVALDAIAACGGASEAADTLRALLSEGDSKPATALLYGFSFVLVVEREGQLLPRPDFEPRYRSAEGDFPPPIDQWPSELEAILMRAAMHPSASVLTRAQIGHALWRLRPSGATRPLAEGALTSAIEFGADRGKEVWERYRLLAMALDLARRLSDGAGRTEALSALLAAADLVIEPSETAGHGSGTAHDILRLYLANGGESSEASARLEKAIIEFGEESRGRTELAVLLASTTNENESRKTILGQELDRLIIEADEHNGLMKDQLLREAQQLARTHGLSDHIRATGVKLAQMTVSDFDLKEHDVHVKIPGDVYRSVMAPFAKGQPPEEGLRSLVNLFPPFAPTPASRERSAIELIASPVEISGQGLVTHAPSTPDELADYWQRHDDDTLSQFYVGFLDSALQEAVKREDFRDLLLQLLGECDLFTDKGKERFLRALDAYVAGDWDAVLDTLPTIEAGIRELARQQGALTINSAGSATTMANQQKLMRGLLESLTSTVPSCRRLFRYWEFMLVDQLGWNIRNAYLHGLMEEGTRASAGIVVHILIQLLIPLR